MFSLTGLFFVVTGIQYWMPTYIMAVYKLTDADAAVFYGTTTLSGPVSGVVIGGIVTTAFGGYNTVIAQKL